MNAGYRVGFRSLFVPMTSMYWGLAVDLEQFQRDRESRCSRALAKERCEIRSMEFQCFDMLVAMTQWREIAASYGRTGSTVDCIV